MATSPKTNRMVLAAVIASSIAIPAEGLRQVAYRDPPGVLTVCFGSANNVQVGKTYSLEECNERLTNEMREAIETVERCVPGLPVGMLAAFGDAVFNLGPTIVCDKKNSTAARMLAGGSAHWEDACRQLPRWSKAKVSGFYIELPGLVKRRQREMEVCIQGAA